MGMVLLLLALLCLAMTFGLYGLVLLCDAILGEDDE